MPPGIYRVNGQMQRSYALIKQEKQSMNHMSDSNAQSVRIIKTIDEIAFQTKLLAPTTEHGGAPNKPETDIIDPGEETGGPSPCPIGLVKEAKPLQWTLIESNRHQSSLTRRAGVIVHVRYRYRRVYRIPVGPTGKTSRNWRRTPGGRRSDVIGTGWPPLPDHGRNDESPDIRYNINPNDRKSIFTLNLSKKLIIPLQPK